MKTIIVIDSRFAIYNQKNFKIHPITLEYYFAKNIDSLITYPKEKTHEY